MPTSAKRKKTPSKKLKAPSLAQRITKLEDTEAIRTIAATVNWCVDSQQFDAMLAHFTDDIVYDIGHFGVYRGKAALRDFLGQMTASFGLILHRTLNQVIEVHGDTATSRCYYDTSLEFQGQSLIGAGEYHDELVKRGGRWLVRHRTAKFTYFVPLNKGWGKERIVNLAESANQGAQ